MRLTSALVHRAASLIFVIVSTRGAFARPVDTDTVKAIEMLRAATQSIANFDLYLRVDTTHLVEFEIQGKGRDTRVVRSEPAKSPKVRTQYFRQSKAGDKLRYDEFATPTGNSIYSAVSDCRVSKFYYPKDAEMMLASATSNMVPDGCDYRETYECASGTWTIKDTIGKRKSVALKLPLEESSVTISVGPEPLADASSPRMAFEFSLSTKHGMMPKSIRIYEPKDENRILIREMDNVEWQNIGSGLWAPIKARTKFFNAQDNGTLGQIAALVEMSVDTRRSKWNSTIEDRRFELSTPAGTRVSDTLRKIEYVQGAPDPGKHLDELAATAKQMVPFEFVQQVQPPFNWLMLKIVAVVLIGLVAIAFIVRNLRASRT